MRGNRQIGTGIGFSARHHANRLDHFLGRAAFAQISAGARIQRTTYIDGLIMDTKDQDLGVRIPLEYSSGRLHTTDSRQIEIHDDDIGSRPAVLIHRLFAGLDLSDDCEGRVQLQQNAVSGPDHSMIIHQHHMS